MSSFVFDSSNLPDEICFDVPYSKSISNRLLVIKYFLEKKGMTLELKNLSDSEDTQIISSALQTTNITKQATFDCKNSATALRFLLAVLTITNGNWTLTADKRMEDRQIKPLIEILNSIGAKIVHCDRCLFPLYIKGQAFLEDKNNMLHLSSQYSSQIISALLLIKDYIKGFDLSFSTHQSSLPYIKMTQYLIKYPQTLIEKDWSAASFAYCLIGLRKKGLVVIPNLRRSSLQGDSICEILFRNFGIETKFTSKNAVLSYNSDIKKKDKVEIDVQNCSDLFLPLIVTAAFSQQTTVFYNTNNLKYKESDRINSAITLLSSFGIKIECSENSITVYQQQHYKPVNIPFIKTFNDHRVAMSFAMLSFIYNKVEIENPDCVKKSFPKFWNNFEEINNLNSISNSLQKHK
ncbi:MAG: hypothetical protein LBR28_05210 [Bacteroidales bacterium]|jgi:3-phosphoshikimate 1-carboxyvinyltransferase|nr:hypothetical protein [Bacteroidales bacterium]